MFRFSFRHYVLLTVASTLGLLYSTCEIWQYRYFKIVLYLTSSKAAMMVLGNCVLMFSIFLGYLLKRIFFGKPRERDYEVMYEKLWPAIMETLLAMTIFGDQFNATLVGAFVMLLFIKIFHWILEDRVDFLQQVPLTSILDNVRIVVLMLLLTTVDCALALYSWKHCWLNGPSTMILFGFEFTLLSVMILCTISKFIFNCIDVRMEGNWDNKAKYLLYLAVIQTGFTMVTYTLFFLIVYQFHGLPIYLVRQVWMACSSFRKRCSELTRYLRATAIMDRMLETVALANFPNADPTCIVCREDMVVGKRLPCNHILHLHCLRAWLAQSQNCPICQRPVFPPHMPHPQYMQFQMGAIPFMVPQAAGFWVPQFMPQNGYAPAVNIPAPQPHIPQANQPAPQPHLPHVQPQPPTPPEWQSAGQPQTSTTPSHTSAASASASASASAAAPASTTTTTTAPATHPTESPYELQMRLQWQLDSLMQQQAALQAQISQAWELNAALLSSATTTPAQPRQPNTPQSQSQPQPPAATTATTTTTPTAYTATPSTSSTSTSTSTAKPTPISTADSASNSSNSPPASPEEIRKRRLQKLSTSE
ncbi:zinc finger protein [Pelomyxa schiedti]|nr:zinc finger protein [Pelomyxa schiedti]